MTSVAGLSTIFLLACSAQVGSSSSPAKSGVESVYTSLTGDSCRTELDKSDPNETPYQVCPGVAGYSLIVRRVDSGRRSIDVVDPARRAHPLDYQRFVTRHMFSLGDKAEWRVAARNGQQVPIALIAHVRAREDNKSPEKVTQTYVAVAKIGPGEACVTDSVAEGSQSDAWVRGAADSAQEKKCAPPRPPLTVNGTVVR